MKGVLSLSAGYSHTVYLKSDGTVWSAGKNSSGQLGDGTTINRYNPVQVVLTAEELFRSPLIKSVSVGIGIP